VRGYKKWQRYVEETGGGRSRWGRRRRACSSGDHTTDTTDWQHKTGREKDEFFGGVTTSVVVLGPSQLETTVLEQYQCTID